MKKKLISLLLASTMAVSLLSGCGSSAENASGQEEEVTTDAEGEGGDTAAEESDAAASGSSDAISNLIAATEGTVDLTLWCSETEAYQTVMAELVDDFKKTYPDVDFNITIGVESDANCKDDVLADVEAAADLFVLPDDQLLDLVKAGALQSVDATYTYDPAATNAASTVEAASVDGTLYAYPMTASNGYFLFYDKNALSEEDVASWDNLLAAAEAQGKTVGMEVSGAWYLYGFFAGAGLDMYMNEDGKNVCNWNATDTKYTGADVALAISELCKNSAMKNCVNEDAQAFALNGEMIADVNGTWATSAFQEAYGDGYAAVKLPTFTVNGDQVQMGSFAGYKFIGVNAYSKNPGWAMLLAEFLTNEASQTKIGIATGEGPSNLVAASSSEIASAPALAALAQQSEYANLQRVGDNYWGPAATLGESLVEGNYLDIQTLLDEAVEGITQ
ncbi:MAG: extracellular solute-binding protein [Lachnospiraceae bacterium]|nr:extracellular solute-binding protein [Lachnospiraceae bacterium]